MLPPTYPQPQPHGNAKKYKNFPLVTVPATHDDLQASYGNVESALRLALTNCDEETVLRAAWGLVSIAKEFWSDAGMIPVRCFAQAHIHPAESSTKPGIFFVDVSSAEEMIFVEYDAASKSSGVVICPACRGKMTLAHELQQHVCQQVAVYNHLLTGDSDYTKETCAKMLSFLRAFKNNKTDYNGLVRMFSERIFMCSLPIEFVWRTMMLHKINFTLLDRLQDWIPEFKETISKMREEVLMKAGFDTFGRPLCAAPNTDVDLNGA